MQERQSNDTAARPNIVLIMSDEHNPYMTGCYGSEQVRTPHLDALAKDGFVFDRAYCNSPICVPSRMSFLTGKYVNKIGVWDLDSRLSDESETFAHVLGRNGYETALCGRMHMTGSDRLRGFDKRLVDDEEEWLSEIVVPERKPESRRWSHSHVSECGPGIGSHQAYDRKVADAAVKYLQGKAALEDGKPWMLTVGFMFPHFPLIAPQAYYDLYDPDCLPLPDLRGETLGSQHPVIRQLRYFFRTDEELPEWLVRRALASYYALVTLTDHHIGMILNTIYQSSLHRDTIVIYVSDHGEMAGEHGLWQKNCFYESSVRIPMIVRMPGETGGRRIGENVSLVDLFPTLLEMTGMSTDTIETDGKSILGLLRGELQPQRIVFSEYHAQGMLNAGYMIVQGDWKFNYYVGERPQLFNIRQDRGEFTDLSSNPAYAPIAADLKQALFERVDPEAVNRKAHSDQEARRSRRNGNVQ